MATAARKTRASTTCPFLRELTGDEGPLCLSDPDEPETITATYVSTICTRTRHFTCKRFVAAGPDARRAMIAAAAEADISGNRAPPMAAPSAPVAEPAAKPSPRVVITSPRTGTRTDETELLITGTAQAGAAVVLFDGPARVAETATDESGSWSAIVTMNRPGRHVWTAALLQTNDRTSPRSAPCTVISTTGTAGAAGRTDRPARPAAPRVDRPFIESAPRTSGLASNKPGESQEQRTLATEKSSEPDARSAAERESGPRAEHPAELAGTLPPVLAPARQRPAATAPQYRQPPLTGNRLPTKKAALAGIAAAAVVAFAIVEYPRLHHHAASRATVLPAVSRPTPKGNAPASASTAIPTIAPTLAGTAIASNKSSMTSWHFKALTGHPRLVMIGIFNPATFGVIADVRIVQGGHVDAHRVRIEAGKTVQLHPAWLTAAAVTVDADPEVIPVRVATR